MEREQGTSLLSTRCNAAILATHGGHNLPGKVGTEIVLSAALTSMAFGAGLEKSRLHGEYVEARTADIFTGPCFANAEVNLMGDLAVDDQD